MNKSLKWLTVLFSALIVAVAAVEITRYEIPSNGKVKAVGVSLTWVGNDTEVTEFNWGIIDNATTYIMEPINITNIKNAPCTLSLSTANLSLSIISLTLTWNYTNTILQPNTSVIVEISQTITATGDYFYNTIITATEAP